MIDSIVNNINKKNTEVQKVEEPPKKVTKKKPTTKLKESEKTSVELPVPSTPVDLDTSDKDSIFNSFMQNKTVQNMGLSEDEMLVIKSEIQNNITDTMTAVIKLCDSTSCKQREICPFNKISKYPEGMACPVEVAISEFLSKEYYSLVKEETGSDQYNIVEISTISSLIEVELEEFRARIYTTQEGQITRQPAFVVKETGQVVYNDVENPLYNLRERLDRKKQKLLQRLLITPESKARFKIEDKGRGGKSVTDLISSAEGKIKELKKLGKPNEPEGSEIS